MSANIQPGPGGQSGNAAASQELAAFDLLVIHPGVELELRDLSGAIVPPQFVQRRGASTRLLLRELFLPSWLALPEPRPPIASCLEVMARSFVAAVALCRDVKRVLIVRRFVSP